MLATLVSFIDQLHLSVSCTTMQKVNKSIRIWPHRNKQISASNPVFTMETNDSLDFAQHVYRKQPFHTLDDKHFEEKIPPDNGRHDCTPISTVFATSQLNKLPVQKFSSRSCYSQTFLLPLASAALTAAQCSLSTQSSSTLQLSASRQTPLTVLHCMEHFLQSSVPPAIAKAIISIW